MSRPLTITVVFFLAIVGLLGQVAAIGHALDTAHAVCEHGEVVHTEAGSPTSVAAAGAALGTKADAEHEHGCALLSGICEPESAALHSDSVLAPAPARTTACLLSPAVSPFHRSPLHVAPKTSPPGPSTHA